MATSLERLHYHVADDSDLSHDHAARSPESFRAETRASEVEDASPLAFNSNEAAARYYLDQLLQRDERPALRSVIEPERPERVPGLIVDGEQDVRIMGTHQVRFAQTHQGIPVFGANAVVELTEGRELVSVTAQLDEVTGVDPVESLSRADALMRVARYTGGPLPREAGLGGTLTFYKDDDFGSWHLAWLLPGLPVEPPVTGEDTDDGPGTDTAPGEVPILDHGMGPRPTPLSYNYLVDAHDGEILFHYSAIPTALPIPTRCTGLDEDEKQQRFLGQLAAPAGTTCQLSDPLRGVRTFDLQFADIDTDPPIPDRPVEATNSDYGLPLRGVPGHRPSGPVEQPDRLATARIDWPQRRPGLRR